VADFRPVEAAKARILSIRPAPADTTVRDANAEWIEVQVTLDSDLANWRLQHLRALWRETVAKPVEWEWVYTRGRDLPHPLGVASARCDASAGRRPRLRT
jgi:hypothetical protein